MLRAKIDALTILKLWTLKQFLCTSKHWHQAPSNPELCVFITVCVFITAGPITVTKLFAGGGGVCVYYCRTYYKAVRGGGRRRVEDMCYERRRAEACVDESAHSVFSMLMCVFITAGPITKLFAEGGGPEESGRHVL